MGELCWKCGAPAKGIASSVDAPEASSQTLTHLLKSNDIPLDSDTPFIRDIISRGQHSVAELDAQIGDLCRLRKETAECVRQHRAVISPVRRMPPELICEIFALAWFSEDDLNRTIPRKSELRAPPWNFGLICRSWRRTALAYTGFWTSVTIPSSPTSESVTAARTSMIQTQLFRSGNAPLRVFCQNDHSSVHLRPAELVIAQCSRWSTFHLYSDNPGNPSWDWLRPTAGRLTQLLKLDIVAQRANPIPDVFLTAPAWPRPCEMLSSPGRISKVRTK
ncbi:hypothetical protein DFH06DRAFT_1225202 [Mycena polygramma]|nr:hypothetical protein DFH06DRAFT_1225202 [Mycena polygramma]